MTNEELEAEDDRCKECEKDWTKCSKCPVMMKWVKEHKVRDKEVEDENNETNY